MPDQPGKSAYLLSPWTIQALFSSIYCLSKPDLIRVQSKRGHRSLHTAFIAEQYDFKSIMFRPPLSIEFISTFLAILSLLYFHKKLKSSLLISFNILSGIPMAETKYTNFDNAIDFITNILPCNDKSL